MIDEMMWVFQALLAIMAGLNVWHYVRDRDDAALRQTFRLTALLVFLIGMGLTLPQHEPWTHLMLEGAQLTWLTALLSGSLCAVTVTAASSLTFASIRHFTQPQCQYG